MNTVMIPNAFPAAIPAYANPVQPGNGSWRPAAHSVPVHLMPRPGQPHWRPSVHLGQATPPAASLAKGADVLFSMLTAIGAMTVGIAAMTIGIGGEKAAVPGQGRPPSLTWRWLGGITAGLGLLTILSNVSKISKVSEVIPANQQTSAR